MLNTLKYNTYYGYGIVFRKSDIDICNKICKLGKFIEKNILQFNINGNIMNFIYIVNTDYSGNFIGSILFLEESFSILEKEFSNDESNMCFIVGVNNNKYINYLHIFTNLLFSIGIDISTLKYKFNTYLYNMVS
jgi:hypothetical protein